MSSFRLAFARRIRKEFLLRPCWRLGADGPRARAHKLRWCFRVPSTIRACQVPVIHFEALL